MTICKEIKSIKRPFENHFINYAKAFCIILILITHSEIRDNARSWIIFPFVINMAVPIFIFITGFNYSNSNLRRGLDTFLSMLNLKLLLRRFLRLAIPFSIILSIEIIFNIGGDYSSHGFFTYFINSHALPGNFFIGGFGPGSYYFPVMMQLIIMFPFLYWIIHKFNSKGIIFIFILNILYEIVCNLINIDSATYRLQSFRYLFCFSTGIWFAHNQQIKNKLILLVSFIFGITYILLKSYTSINIPFDNGWGAFPCLSTFYLFPIFYFSYKKLNDKTIKFKFFDTIFSLLGKASWHIFLVQMIYYTCINNESIYKELPLMLNIFINIGSCSIIGILFYKLESSILNKEDLK